MTFHPWDVSLSLAEPDSSALNVFRGKVTSISHLGGRTRVTVEAGISVIAELTHLSEERLGLELGREVYASFKASALQVYT
jgi:molybdopterin-binding protein